VHEFAVQSCSWARRSRHILANGFLFRACLPTLVRASLPFVSAPSVRQQNSNVGLIAREPDHVAIKPVILAGDLPTISPIGGGRDRPHARCHAIVDGIRELTRCPAQASCPPRTAMCSLPCCRSWACGQHGRWYQYSSLPEPAGIYRLAAADQRKCLLVPMSCSRHGHWIGSNMRAGAWSER
jgi:hypothetical protein